MYSIASESTDAVSVFPKGETNCWSAVILSPIFSFLTLKGGKVEVAVSVLALFILFSVPPFFAAVELVSLTSIELCNLGFSSKVGMGT